MAQSKKGPDAQAKRVISEHNEEQRKIKALTGGTLSSGFQFPGRRADALRLEGFEDLNDEANPDLHRDARDNMYNEMSVLKEQFGGFNFHISRNVGLGRSNGRY